MKAFWESPPKQFLPQLASTVETALITQIMTTAGASCQLSLKMQRIHSNINDACVPCYRKLEKELNICAVEACCLWSSFIKEKMLIFSRVYCCSLIIRICIIGLIATACRFLAPPVPLNKRIFLPTKEWWSERYCCSLDFRVV